jgi:hypothetical protein
LYRLATWAVSGRWVFVFCDLAFELAVSENRFETAFEWTLDYGRSELCRLAAFEWIKLLWDGVLCDFWSAFSASASYALRLITDLVSEGSFGAYALFSHDFSLFRLASCIDIVFDWITFSPD